MNKILPWLVCGAFLLLVWTLMSWALGPFAIPTPSSAWSALTTQGDRHIHNVLVSAALALGGLTLACIVAVGFVIVVGIAPSTRNYFYPFFVIVKSTPALAI